MREGDVIVGVWGRAERTSASTRSPLTTKRLAFSHGTDYRQLAIQTHNDNKLVKQHRHVITRPMFHGADLASPITCLVWDLTERVLDANTPRPRLASPTRCPS